MKTGYLLDPRQKARQWEAKRYLQPPRMISAGKTAQMLLANILTAGDAARKRDLLTGGAV
jgi:hypothetical protein